MSFIGKPLADDIAELILQKIYAGETTKKSLEFHGISNSAWDLYKQRNPLFEEKILRARLLNAEMHIEEIISISDDPDLDPQHARNRIDARKWMASKLIPHTFGDQLNVNVQGKLDIAAAMGAQWSYAFPTNIDAEPAELKQLDTGSGEDALKKGIEDLLS